MTIGKKLYIGFGSILVILIGLFAVNIVAGLREKSARSDASEFAAERSSDRVGSLPDHAEPQQPEQFSS